MIIDSITLENYRQYKNVTIELGIDANRRNVIIIEGDNGAGKSTLFNAITWCLYGKESLTSEKSKGLPLINTATLHEMTPNENRTVKVKICFLTNDKSMGYTVERVAWFKKTKDGSAEQIVMKSLSNQPDGTKLELFGYYKRGGGDVKVHFQNLKRTINQLFPEEISEYFFFDGERLDRYFKEKEGKKIKEAVFKISQLELLDRMVTHIESAQKTYLRNCENRTSNVEELEKQIESLKKSLDEIKKQKENEVEQLKKAEANKEKINKQLQECSVPNVERLAKEKERLNEDISNIDDELKTLKEEHVKNLIEKSPIVFTYSAINYANKIISQRKEAGEIPPKYRKGFLEGLIKEGKCICGVDISQDNEYRKCIEEKLSQCDEVAENCEELIELGGNLRSLTNDTNKIEKLLKSQRDKITKKNKEREEKNKRLKEIEDEIKGCDIEKIRQLEETLEEFEEQIKKSERKIGEFDAKIDGITKQIDIAEAELRREIRRDQQLAELNKVISFADKALEAAEKVKETIMEETRKEVEQKTKEQFLNIIWKKETYKRIEISDHYDLMVYDQKDRHALSTLSAGEREALALSFMAALNEVSGFDVPIVIDTPLGRIGQQQRVNIANCLPKLFEKTQVVLLVTDTEYTEEVKNGIKESVYKEFKIFFHEGKYGNEAKIEQYNKAEVSIHGQ
ncbi:MAG: AAA family ATPase [Thermoplasmata archaeon]